MLVKTLLMVLVCLVALSVCSPQKKSCIRPAVFRDVGEVADYVKCIKTITGSPPYGKRSISQQQPAAIGPFFQKMHPVLRDYDPEYLEELIYQILKTQREMQT